jgi:hypothetical protein
MLLPQDILLILKLQALRHDQDSRQSEYPTWTYAYLGDSIGISPSQAHLSMDRAVASELVRLDGSIRPKAVFETLLAVKYYMPGRYGGITRGVPTAYAAPPLSLQIAPSDEPLPVWPFPDGPSRGVAFDPIYKTAPLAALNDGVLYEYLSLVDALRSGRAREASLARAELERRLGVLE